MTHMIKLQSLPIVYRDKQLLQGGACTTYGLCIPVWLIKYKPYIGDIKLRLE